MKEEILTKDEKKELEKYINFMLQNGFKKEEFEFTKMPNPNPYVLKVRVRDFSKNFNIENGVLEGMALGKTYTWEELGLYASKDILSDKEKEYLSAVIKPFRNEILIIEKAYFKEDEWLYFTMNRGNFTLPYFKMGTMYKGMEEGREYTLEELGL